MFGSGSARELISRAARRAAASKGATIPDPARREHLRRAGSNLQPMTTHPTFGVEEEFLLVDPSSGEPVPRNRAVAEHAKALGVELELELTSCQVETTSEVMASSADLRAEMVRLRRVASEAAEAAGARLLAVGLPPTVPHDFPITDKPRYREIAEQVRDDRPRAGNLWLPRARGSSDAGVGGSGGQPAAAVAAVVAGADGQLGGLPQRRHRVRQLAQRAVGAVAQCGPAAALRFGRRVRRGGRDDAGRWRHDGRRHGLLGRPPVGQLPDHRGARGRRARHGRRDGPAGHAGAGRRS